MITRQKILIVLYILWLAVLLSFEFLGLHVPAAADPLSRFFWCIPLDFLAFLTALGGMYRQTGKINVFGILGIGLLGMADLVFGFSFPAGFGLFFIGQIFLAAGFFRLYAGSKLKDILLGLGILALTGGYQVLLFSKAGFQLLFGTAVCLYGLLLALNSWRAFVLPKGTIGRIPTILGTLLFMLSDTALSWGLFADKTWGKFFPVITVLFYSSLLFLGLGLGTLRKN